MDISSRAQAVAVDELERDLVKFVHVEDVADAYTSDGDDNSDAEEYVDIKPYGPEPVKKCSGMPATFPCNDKSSPGDKVEQDGEPEMALQILSKEEPVQLHRTLSVPLVSAVKGSREKLGAAPRKLTVTWAPDVYDPIPNSMSHTVNTVKGKQKKSRKDNYRDNNYSKKNKKGQKGNTSRSGGGKDKKQFRKHGGRSDRGQRPMDNVDRFVHASGDFDDFDVGSPDNCGSSFLKESLTKVHYTVAEAS